MNGGVVKKFISYVILISFLVFSLFYDGIKNYVYAADKPLKTDVSNEASQWEFNKTSFNGMKTGFLDFTGSNWSIAAENGREVITHKWKGFSVKFNASVVQVPKLKLEATQTYSRTLDTDRYKFNQADPSKVRLKVFRMDAPFNDFGLVAEDLGAGAYQILGMLWASEKNESYKQHCDADPDVTTVVYPAAATTYGGVYQMYANNYDGDIQGDSVSSQVGLCAYDPQRLKEERFQRRNYSSDMFYYIFNLNQFFGKKYNNGGPLVSSIAGKNRPTKDKIATCGNNSNIFMDKPLTWYADDAHKLVFDSLKNALLEGVDEDAKTSVVSYLNDPNLISKDEDQTLYQMFYRSGSNSEKFPDLKVDQNLSDSFTNLIIQSKINSAMMSANDKDKDSVENWETTVKVVGGTVVGGKIAFGATTKGLPWLYNKLVSSAAAMKTPVGKALVTNGVAELSQVAQVAETTGGGLIPAGMRASSIIGINGEAMLLPTTITAETEAAMIAGGTSTAGTGSAIASFLGPIVIFVLIAMMAYFGYLLYKKIQFENSVKDLIRDMVKVELAYSYILANKEYQKCAETWDSDQQTFFQKISAAKDEAIQSAKDALNAAYKDICPQASFAIIPSWFQASLCGLGMALWEAGQSLMKFASKQFEQVLGIRYGLGY